MTITLPSMNNNTLTNMNNEQNIPYLINNTVQFINCTVISFWTFAILLDGTVA